MKRKTRNIFILLAPYLLMVLVNEGMRSSMEGTPFHKPGVTAMNSAVVNPDKCSWNCHNNTAYCIKHHVKMDKAYFKYVDPIYFGIIHLLKATGNYGIANIVFLVVLIPLLIYWLLVKSLDMQVRIRQLKKATRT